MLLWHLGAGLWIFRWVFRDPKVDVRFLLPGLLIPDLVDLPVGTILAADRFSTGELWFHSLTVASLYMVAVLMATRRGRRRRAWMAVGVGWLLHLILNGMWTNPEILFWPFFGRGLGPGDAPFWSLAWERALSDPWRWLKELAGLGYLVWLWFAVGLADPRRRALLITTGRIPSRVAE